MTSVFSFGHFCSISVSEMIVLSQNLVCFYYLFLLYLICYCHVFGAEWLSRFDLGQPHCLKAVPTCFIFSLVSVQSFFSCFCHSCSAILENVNPTLLLFLSWIIGSFLSLDIPSITQAGPKNTHVTEQNKTLLRHHIPPQLFQSVLFLWS